MRVTRIIVVGLLAAMLAGCAGSSRMDSFVNGVEVPSEPFIAVAPTTEATASRWSVVCSKVGPKICSALLTIKDNDTNWLEVGALMEKSGALTLGFSVPLEAKQFGAIVVESDSNVEGILKLRGCSLQNCHTVWQLTREQKEKLLGGKSLEIFYALNSGVNKKFVLSPQELKNGLARL